MTSDVANVPLLGRRILITGAGRGLGRAHALAAAAAGATVVVNDTGVALDGTGAADPAPADSVVSEIRQAGGKAEANYEDVTTHDGAAAAVEFTERSLGGLDGLVNSVGVLRDRTFGKLSMADFDEVVRAHLGSAVYTTRAAWEALGRSGSGRVVVTSSASGLYGQFGQANYASAKMGLVGLVNVLKQEGAKRGILVNAIAPVARTRMTAPLLPEDVAAGLDPELVSPVVTHLVADSCVDTGLVLEVGGGMVARARVVESEPVPVGVPGAPEVAEALATLRTAAVGQPFSSSEEALARIMTSARHQERR